MQGLCARLTRGIHLPSKCHRHETGFGKEMWFEISNVFCLFGMDASGCADELWWFFCPCTVVFPLN